jgi:hypothetical protein
MITPNSYSVAAGNLQTLTAVPEQTAASRKWLVVIQNLPEKVARYLLGLFYLHGAVDGAMQILFHVYYTDERERGTFVGTLQHTTYFWAFMKSCQLIGAFSLLMNYKPVLGFVILAPISVVLCLFYLFEIQWYGYFFVISSANLVLFWAYRKSFLPLLRD